MEDFDDKSRYGPQRVKRGGVEGVTSHLRSFYWLLISHFQVAIANNYK